MYDEYQNSFLTLTISIFDSVVLYGTRFLLFLTERIMCTSFVFTGDVEYCIILSKALLFDSIILFLNLFYYEVDWPILVFHWTILLLVSTCFIFWFWEYFLIGDLIVFFRCFWLDVLRIFFIDDSIEFFRSFLMDVMFFLIFSF